MTTDTFFDGRLKLYQSSGGYRFSIDAVLLAAQPNPKPGDVLMDIGTGCGIVPIILAFRHPKARYIGIELQARLAEIAKKNVAVNHMQEQIVILNQDIRRLKVDTVPGPVDWIVSNPPFHPAQSGRINPNTERALARHELNLTLRELIQAVRRFLKTGGRFATIYPVDRLVDLFHEMRCAGIEPKWMQIIHSRSDDAPKLVLVQGMAHGNRGLKVAPPLTIYGADGAYSENVQKMMVP